MDNISSEVTASTTSTLSMDSIFSEVKTPTSIPLHMDNISSSEVDITWARNLEVETPIIVQPTTVLSLNYDVLIGVFEALKGTLSSHGGKDLLSIAVVCTKFRDPAIDILWESMDSIIPLLRLLPPVELVNGVYMICGDIWDEDMSRFKFYAKKIRRLTRSSVGSRYPPIAPPVLALLQQDLHIRDLIFSSFEALSAPEAPLLIPFRSTLYTSDASSVFAVSPLQWVNPADSSSFIQSSSLERVEIREASNGVRDLDSDFSRIRPFMYALKTRAPDLQHLVVGIQTSPRVWELIANFHNLRSLEFSGVLDLNSFHLLAVSLPELQRLSVNILNPVNVDSNFDVTFPFDKLHTLKMSGRGLTLASYLRCMRGGSVEVLSVNGDKTLPFDSGGEQWGSYMSFMKKQWASSLKSVHLKASQNVCIPMSSMFLSDLAAISLKSLVIEAKISALDCKNLSRSLPALSSLYIQRVESAGSLAKAGINILAAFATYCRNLVSMEIGFEGRISDSFSYLSSMRPVGGHTLKSLVITSDDCAVDIQNFQYLIDAARLLYRLFPALDTLRSSDKHASAVFWNHAYKLYKEFRGFAKLQEDDFPWYSEIPGGRKRTLKKRRP
ncbi:hypothetical protein H0H92_000584 [Tricholoma furcatifolium]|nr:hypothetical protein H0H92_000584 [Tricholoma furcatifolium]